MDSKSKRAVFGELPQNQTSSTMDSKVKQSLEPKKISSSGHQSKGSENKVMCPTQQTAPASAKQ